MVTRMTLQVKRRDEVLELMVVLLPCPRLLGEYRVQASAMSVCDRLLDGILAADMAYSSGQCACQEVADGGWLDSNRISSHAELEWAPVSIALPGRVERLVLSASCSRRRGIMSR